ncbi:hypothetical protein V1522DRAFT_393753 [Lipomyces starkeyi]
MESIDNSIKLAGFTALTAAVLLFLYFLGYGRPTTGEQAFAHHTSTYDESLISKGTWRDIVLPCFGVVSVDRKNDNTPQSHARASLDSSTRMNPTCNNISHSGTLQINDDASTPPIPFDDIFVTYHGPWAAHNPTVWLPAGLSNANLNGLLRLITVISLSNCFGEAKDSRI